MSNELTVTQAAESRRSIRKYTSEPVSRETISEIIRVAGLAPSPWNLQPWRVIAVTDEETKQKLMAAAFGQPQVGSAPVVFVIATDMNDVLANVADTIHPGYDEGAAEGVKGQILGHFDSYSEADLHWWGKAQGYSFMSYLLLAAEAHGYATSPMLGFVPDQVRELFGFESHVQIPALVAMGRKDEEGFPTFRHPQERFVRFV
ncbi:MAG: nitroreductase family protein [Fimbriimonadaceae bacterium]|nr:nitroreductase family protein [Fimbriimonadaceae bacterium]